jgi:hypothetical protein
MTGKDLKTVFLKAYRRDRKLILMNYGIRSAGILLVLCALWFLFRTFESNQARQVALDSLGNYKAISHYVIYLLMAVAAGTIIYPFYRYWKARTQVKEIDRLMQCIDSGAKAHTLKKYTKHKITIPLITKTIRWFPVDYLYIIMDNDNRSFRLSASKSYIEEIKEGLIKPDTRNL